MKFGLFVPVARQADASSLPALGTGAEQRGFDSIWIAEHLVLFDEYASSYPYAEDGRIPAPPEAGFLEPFGTLSFLAAATREIRLGTGICLVPQRNPVYTAKDVSNLDFLSGGRFDFGIGVGWLAEEFGVSGVPFERRGARCRSYLEVMRRLWCDDVSEYKDEFYELPACRMFPKPVQQPHPPLHFGGESEAALRRVADLGQGWYGFDRSPEQALEGIEQLVRLLADRGRTRDDVQVSICPYLRPLVRGDVSRYEDSGVDQLIFFAAAGDRDGLRARLDELAALKG